MATKDKYNSVFLKHNFVVITECISWVLIVWCQYIIF